MGVLFACMIVSFIVVSAAILALWATSTRRIDKRLARLEAHHNHDRDAFVHQAWIHDAKIVDLYQQVRGVNHDLLSVANAVSTLDFESRVTTLSPPPK